MNNSQRPAARKEGLVIQEMPDEILVFDMETNKAHCLNETAAFVWKACDGKNSVADITKLFGSESGKPVQEELVWLAIDQLSDNNLLEKKLESNLGGQSRREVIKKIGMAAVIALPVVASLVAPTAALAVACSGPAVSNCSPCSNMIACTTCNSCPPPPTSTTNGGPGTCAGGGSSTCTCTAAC